MYMETATTPHMGFGNHCLTPLVDPKTSIVYGHWSLEVRLVGYAIELSRGMHFLGSDCLWEYMYCVAFLCM